MSLTPNGSDCHIGALACRHVPFSALLQFRAFAAVVNEEIRDLWQRSGGCLSPDDEEEYQRLLVEWAAVTGGSARSAA